MPTKIAVISDTHIYKAQLPRWVREQISRSDHLIHAGDFVSDTALQYIEDLAGGSLTAVRGNSDLLSASLDEVRAISVEGVEIVVTHPLGIGEVSMEVNRYFETISSAVKHHTDYTESKPILGIAGHTHRPLDYEFDGFRLLNPGSPTDASSRAEASMLSLNLDQGEVEVELVRPIND